MKQSYTYNDLLPLIYDELNDCCTSYKIKSEILADEQLAKEYRELKSAVSLLNSNDLAPKSQTIESILHRSKQGELAS